jgi:hopanoid biosynthesis associated RND transporter like protein HpnN
VITLLITGWTFNYVVENLGVDTNTENILSPDLPFRQSDKHYAQLFPQYEDTLLIVIEGDIPERAWDGARRLAAKLEQNDALFKRVYLPQANDFFERYGLMYLDLPELEEMTDNLAQAQPFLGRLTQDPTLGGLLEMLDEIIKAKHSGETTLDLQPIFGPINKTIGAVLDGQSHPLSWQKLMHGDSVASEGQHQFLIVQPHMDFSRLLPAKSAIETIRALAQELQLDSAHGMQVRITGDVALSHEELEGVITGSGIAGMLALVMTSALLLIGLRSASLVLAILLTLIIGLILTAGFATLAVGHLNLISTAFGILYIGLGAEYAIQFCVRYQQLTRNRVNQLKALRTTASEVGIALILCALTTAIGFYAFIPTDFSGVSELGLIAGTGMFINLGLTLIFLPALLRFLPVPLTSSRKVKKRTFDFLFNWPLHHRRSILWGSLILGLGMLVLLPQIRFNYNPIDLRNPKSESVSTLRELTETETIPLWSAIVLAPDASKAQQLAGQLKQLDTVEAVITVQNFIPDHQEEKLDIIDELALSLGPLLGPSASDPTAIETKQDQVTLNQFLHTLDTYLADPAAKPSPAAYQLAESFQRLLDRLRQSESATQRQLLLNLQHSLLATLPANLSRLQHSLQAGPITLNTLPPYLRHRWIAPNGVQQLEIFPKKGLNINDPASLHRFVGEVHSIAPSATGSLVLNLKSGEVVVASFQKAFVYALIAIIAVLLLLLRSLQDTLLVLVPLLLAGILLGATMVILNISFNFANVIALPLLLGVGVDSGIYMVQRVRRAPLKTGNLLRTSTTRALVLSTLVTVLSFGNMLFTSHPGMVSMGLVLAIGVTLTLLCTLLVLPALLMATQRRHAPP